MLCVTLTLAKSVPDSSAEQVIDQLVGSLRSHPDAAGGEVAGFQARGGRQVQGCLVTADETVGFILSAARSGIWGIHLTLVPGLAGSELDDDESRALRQAMELAVTDAPRSLRVPGAVRVVLASSGELLDAKRLPSIGPIESAVQLLSAIERRRSDEGQEAGLLINAGRSQAGAAKTLGVSQQAVSSRLQAGYWYESRKVAFWLAAQIDELLAS